MDNLRGSKFPLLDYGFIRLVDYMGDDASVVEAAKVSYGVTEGELQHSTIRKLIRYLIRHRHSSPLEMAELKLHIKCPIFVARQWHRHRTWSYNEISGRYTELPCEYYTPDEWRMQSETNKQGSSDLNYEGDLDLDYKAECFSANELYGIACGEGVSRELSRCVLPLSTYTEFYSKVDLSNLLKFVSLRSDSHAQYEIRVYSDTILKEIVKPLFPLCYEAFIDYELESMSLSRLDQTVIKEIVKLDSSSPSYSSDVSIIVAHTINNKREQDECFDKLSLLGLY